MVNGKGGFLRLWRVAQPDSNDKLRKKSTTPLASTSSPIVLDTNEAGTVLGSQSCQHSSQDWYSSLPRPGRIPSDHHSAGKVSYARNADTHLSDVPDATRQQSACTTPRSTANGSSSSSSSSNPIVRTTKATATTSNSSSSHGQGRVSSKRQQPPPIPIRPVTAILPPDRSATDDDPEDGGYSYAAETGSLDRRRLFRRRSNKATNSKLTTPSSTSVVVEWIEDAPSTQPVWGRREAHLSDSGFEDNHALCDDLSPGSAMVHACPTGRHLSARKQHDCTSTDRSLGVVYTDALDTDRHVATPSTASSSSASRVSTLLRRSHTMKVKRTQPLEDHCRSSLPHHDQASLHHHAPLSTSHSVTADTEGLAGTLRRRLSFRSRSLRGRSSTGSLASHKNSNPSSDTLSQGVGIDIEYEIQPTVTKPRRVLHGASPPPPLQTDTCTSDRPVSNNAMISPSAAVPDVVERSSAITCA